MNTLKIFVLFVVCAKVLVAGEELGENRASKARITVVQEARLHIQVEEDKRCYYTVFKLLFDEEPYNRIGVRVNDLTDGHVPTDYFSSKSKFLQFPKGLNPSFKAEIEAYLKTVKGDSYKFITEEPE